MPNCADWCSTQLPLPILSRAASVAIWGVERLVAEIDRLSLERKAAPTMAIWRDALEVITGVEQPRLL